MNIQPKKVQQTGTLYVRNVPVKHIKWLDEESKRKNMTRGEYIEAVFTELRKSSGKKKRSRRSTARVTR